MNNVLFSCKSDDWKTPDKLYNLFLYNNFFDPCPFHSNFDGLTIAWKKYNFVNPPYSKISQFVDKSIIEHINGNKVYLLIPARTDTKYFRKLVDYGCDINFITGRLHFSSKSSAPFPSCLIKLTGYKTRSVWIDRKEVE